MGAGEEKNGENGAPVNVLLGVWVMLLEGRAEGKKRKKKCRPLGNGGEKTKKRKKENEEREDDPKSEGRSHMGYGRGLRGERKWVG